MPRVKATVTVPAESIAASGPWETAPPAGISGVTAKTGDAEADPGSSASVSSARASAAVDAMVGDAATAAPPESVKRMESFLESGFATILRARSRRRLRANPLTCLRGVPQLGPEATRSSRAGSRTGRP